MTATRALLTTYGSRGDVEPMVALATQLRVLGVEVMLCAPPDPELVELSDREGVPMEPFDQPWRSWERPPTPEERQQRVADFIDAQYDTLARSAAGCDLVVATAMSQFVAPSIAELHGVPYHCALFCPDVLDGLDGHGFDELFGAAINAHRGTVGLPPVTSVAEFMFSRRPLLAADASLGPWRNQAPFDVRHTGAWLLPDRRPLPAELLSFLEAGEPPVYVGFGSMRTVGPGAARTAVEAAREHGRRVVLGQGWAGLVPADDLDDCLPVGEVNQQDLFARVAAVVHHGGAGTTTTAARAGVPQLVVPQGGDQSYWARRVTELGLGVAHDGEALTVRSLSAALAPVLAPETRAQAAAVAPRIGTDGASVAARLVLGEALSRTDPAGRSRPAAGS